MWNNVVLWMLLVVAGWCWGLGVLWMLLVLLVY
jgi:hypothetical protein